MRVPCISRPSTCYSLISQSVSLSVCLTVYYSIAAIAVSPCTYVLYNPQHRLHCMHTYRARGTNAPLQQNKVPSHAFLPTWLGPRQEANTGWMAGLPMSMSNSLLASLPLPNTPHDQDTLVEWGPSAVAALRSAPLLGSHCVASLPSPVPFFPRGPAAFQIPWSMRREPMRCECDSDSSLVTQSRVPLPFTLQIRIATRRFSSQLPLPNQDPDSRSRIAPFTYTVHA